jgi:hypothetical protein
VKETWEETWVWHDETWGISWGNRLMSCFRYMAVVSMWKWQYRIDRCGL